MKHTNYPNENDCAIYPGDYEPLMLEDEVRKEIKHFARGGITHPWVCMTELFDLFELEIAIPGVKREEIFIYVCERVLSVIVLHKERDANDRKSSRLPGFACQCVNRRIRLPENADAQFASAEYTGSILCLHLSKTNQPEQHPDTRIVVY